MSTVYIDCANCGKQNIVDKDDDYNTKCVFCHKPVRRKVGPDWKPDDSGLNTGEKPAVAHQENKDGPPPLYNHGKDKITCRECGETVLPKETHVCKKTPAAVTPGGTVAPAPAVTFPEYDSDAARTLSDKGTGAAAETTVVDNKNDGSTNENSEEIYQGKPKTYKRGKRKWKKRCEGCDFSFTEKDKIFCSKNKCPYRCPPDLRPEHGVRGQTGDAPENGDPGASAYVGEWKPEKEGQHSPDTVPLHPSKEAEMDAFFEYYKAPMIYDYEHMKYREFISKWHVNAAFLSKLFEKWKVSRHNRGGARTEKPHAPAEEERSDDFPSEEARALYQKLMELYEKMGKVLEQAQLPPFPEFSQEWPKEVMVQWFQSRAAMEETLARIRRAADEHQERMCKIDADKALQNRFDSIEDTMDLMQQRIEKTVDIQSREIEATSKFVEAVQKRFDEDKSQKATQKLADEENQPLPPRNFFQRLFRKREIKKYVGKIYPG